MPRTRRRAWFEPWPEQLGVAARKYRAERRRTELAKKPGHVLSPVVVSGREITTTFWGDAWGRNLERYSDFANRLPRGRSYLRSGSVLDLQIAPGRVTAIVSGTELYDVDIHVSPVPQKQWLAICRDTAGAIDSVVELLQGRLSTSVMARLCRQGTGLFPAPKAIRLSCSCPDVATMCKHVAAVLYGIGARLDYDPALLFTLREVKKEELIARAGTGARLTRASAVTRSGRRMEDDEALGEIFGLDLAPRSRRKTKPKPKPKPKP
jgi:uncharacterized Zn finger protein